eukprot:gene23280-28175_t
MEVPSETTTARSTTIKIDPQSEGGAALKKAITDKLVEYLGSYTDDVLAEDRDKPRRGDDFSRGKGRETIRYPDSYSPNFVLVGTETWTAVEMETEKENGGDAPTVKVGATWGGVATLELGAETAAPVVVIDIKPQFVIAAAPPGPYGPAFRPAQRDVGILTPDGKKEVSIFFGLGETAQADGLKPSLKRRLQSREEAGKEGDQDEGENEETMRSAAQGQYRGGQQQQLGEEKVRDVEAGAGKGQGAWTVQSRRKARDGSPEHRGAIRAPPGFFEPAEFKVPTDVHAGNMAPSRRLLATAMRQIKAAPAAAPLVKPAVRVVNRASEGLGDFGESSEEETNKEEDKAPLDAPAAPASRVQSRPLASRLSGVPTAEGRGVEARTGRAERRAGRGIASMFMNATAAAVADANAKSASDAKRVGKRPGSPVNAPGTSASKRVVQLAQ